MRVDVPALRRYWYPVCFAEDLAARPLARTLLGNEVVVWQGPGGRPFAALDACPHRDARLSEGWYGSDRLVCPYHGWEFGGDGACVRIPQQDPAVRVSPQARLATFPATTAIGLVWVCLDSEPVGGLIDLPEMSTPGWRTVREFDTVWRCPAASLLDNNLDIAHIAFVHQATFGVPDRPRINPGSVERTHYGLVSYGGLAVSARPGEAAPNRRRVANEAWMPFSGVLRISYPDGLEHVIIKAIYPIDDGSCGLLQFCVRNDTDDDRPPADIIDFDSRVAAEDRAVLERITRPYRLDLEANVHVAADRPSVALRRLWSEVVAGAWLPGDAPVASNPQPFKAAEGLWI